MRIIPEYIALGIFITVIILYFTNPPPKVLLVSPSVDEKISRLYQDDRDVCYRYEREEINCNS